MVNKSEEASNLDTIQIPPVYKAGPFWESALKNIAKKFYENGIANFRNDVLNLKFFVPTYGYPGNGYSEKQINTIREIASRFPQKQKIFMHQLIKLNLMVLELSS